MYDGLRASRGNPHYHLGVSRIPEASAVEHMLGSHVLVSTMVIVTSASFLVPACLAWSSSRYFHAWLFTSMGMICAVYHFCDTHMPLLLGSQESCGDGVLRLLTKLDHGWLYFCMYQVLLMVLGPEDPFLQVRDALRNSENPSDKVRMQWPSLEVVIGSRLAPAFGMSVFLSSYPSWQDFHWHCIILCNFMCLASCLGFWGHPYRRSWVQEVLLRRNFWHRLVSLCSLPLCGTMIFFLFVEAVHSSMTLALFHVLIASFAVTVMQDVGYPGWKASHNVTEQSSRNPFVAHQLLKAVAIFAVPTLFLTLMVDWVWSGHWRWPTLSMAAAQRPGCYVLTIGGMPALVACGTTFWLISSTISHPYRIVNETWKQWWTAQLSSSKVEQLWPQQSTQRWPFIQQFFRDPTLWSHAAKQAGCNMGYGSVLLGVLVALIREGTPAWDFLHTTMTVFFFLSMWIAVLLTTTSTPWAVPGSRMRHILMFVLTLLIVGLSALFILVNWRHIISLHSIYASTEYLILVLFAVWPITWTAEVRDSWFQRNAEQFEWPVTPWRFTTAPS